MHMMKLLSLFLLCSLLFPSICAPKNKESQEYGDPLYRNLAVFGFSNLGHTALYAGMDFDDNHKIFEASPFHGVQENSRRSMTEAKNWYGAYNLKDNKGPQTFAERKRIMDIAVQLEILDPGYPAFAKDAIIPTSSSWRAGELITPDMIEDLRCDGLVEYAYEYSGEEGASFKLWGKNGNRYDISRYPNEHNDLYLGSNSDPCTELAPVVQRGEAGGACTNLTVAAKVDSPTINIFQGKTPGKTEVTIRGSDQSGIHKISYRWGNSIDINSTTYPQHPTQDFQEVHTWTELSQILHYKVVDGAGNSEGWQEKMIIVE